MRPDTLGWESAAPVAEGWISPLGPRRFLYNVLYFSHLI